MFLMDTGKVILTILGFVAMFTLGIAMARPSMYSANIYFNDLRKAYRTKFIFSQFFLPFLIGNVVILLIKLPKFNYFDLCLNLSMLLFLIPLLMRSMTIEDLYFDEEKKTIARLQLLAVATLLMLIAFRIILGIGIRL